MVKCKLSLDIRKNSMRRNDVWCSIIVQYEDKTFLGLNKTVTIESVYNNSSIQISELSERINTSGGLNDFMLEHINNKIKIATKQTKEDLMIKELMDSVIEIDISKEDLKILSN